MDVIYRRSLWSVTCSAPEIHQNENADDPAEQNVPPPSYFRSAARTVATYIDQILRGAKPADLPVQMSVKFELVVNLKTARAMSLKIPE
jgi:hypothetical protein